MYKNYSHEDEFEPRTTPKPATKFDCLTVPSVPEVSLIFDKPSQQKRIEHRSYVAQSPKLSDSVNLRKKDSASPVPRNGGSYAAWKEENFSLKSTSSHNKDSRNITNVQYASNYAARSRTSTENVVRTPEQHRKSYRASPQNSSSDEKYVQPERHEYGEHNGLYAMRKRDTTIGHNFSENYMDHGQMVPHPVKAPPGNNQRDSRHELYLRLSNEKKIIPENVEQQKIVCNGNGSMGRTPVDSQRLNPMFDKSEYVPTQPTECHPHFSMNACHFPQFYTPPYPNHHTENETVRTLLQLVSSQSEQIKYLQAQVERLLKMQEESFREKQRCLCLSHSQQDESVNIDSAHPVSNSSHIPSSHNHSAQKDVSQPTSTVERTAEHVGEGNNLSDLLHVEQQSKKAFLEQKVSIGVMTSFEFTVQNSPFLLDSESCDREESHRTNDNAHVQNSVNICDKAETLRRYKNSFTRMPSGQLENIVEDSESYLSSTQQQNSSNPNISYSGKDLEKQIQQDTQKESTNCHVQNPSARQEVQDNPTSKENNGRTNLEKYMGRIGDEGARQHNLRNSPRVQMSNKEHDSSESESYIGDSNSYARLDSQRYDYSKKANLATGQNNGRQYPKVDKPTTVKQNNCIEDSLILSGGDLRLNERPPPTPDPSIHVEMQEYSSDEESDKVKRTSKVGWTFYNNVLGQVNQILQDSCVVDEQNQNHTKPAHNVDQEDGDNKAALDTVKVATLEQLRKLGISLAENTEHRELHGNQKMAFDSSFYPRLDCQANMTQTTSAINETSTSMHMKALALKYLSDEQLAELAMQKQGSASLKHMMLSNVQGTNMSFATMRYLERYQLLPGKSNVQNEENSRIFTEVPVKADLKLSKPKNSPLPQRYPLTQTPRTSCPSKILDISTLKQQPKLL